MAENQNTHTILVGSSGAGKSIFLQDIVAPEYPSAFILTNTYNNFLSTLINTIPCDDQYVEERTSLARRIIGYINNDAKPQLIDLVLRTKEEFPDASLRTLTSEAIAFIERCLSGKPVTLFVFDQIERFVADFRYAATHTKETKKVNEIFCLIRLLKGLRELDNVRTVFAIRKDTLFDSIDFLSYSLDAPTDGDQIFQYMYFTGITQSNGQATKQIKQCFDKINKIYPWEEIERFLALSSPSLSNTFLIQLTGYMVEHFGQTDPVRDLIVPPPDHQTERERHSDQPRATGEPRDLFPLFFDQLIAGFHKSFPGRINYDVLRLVMLTIAIENRETGDPITEERLARLAHIPREDVSIVIAYLKKIGVVRTDATEKYEAFRYAHDMLFDHIVESDTFTVRNDLHNVIERLAERRTPTHQLTLVNQFGRVWRDAIDRHNLGAIAVALFIAYGGILSLSSFNIGIEGISSGPVCNDLHYFWSYVWSRLTYVDTCTSLRWYYPAIYIMDCLWVSFIYKLDRGYFTYALSGHPTLRAIAKLMPVVGAALGIAMSFTPILTLVPLISVGVVMASLLLYLGHKQKIDTIFTRTNRAWGIRTLSNMIFSLLLISLHWFMVKEGKLYAALRKNMNNSLHEHLPLFVTAKNISFWATSIFFIWFLMHIRPEQQNNVSLATRLAEYDASSRRSDAQG